MTLNEILDIPLYKSVEITPEIQKTIVHLTANIGNLDYFCNKCSRETVFRPKPYTVFNSMKESVSDKLHPERLTMPAWNLNDGWSITHITTIDRSTWSPCQNMLITPRFECSRNNNHLLHFIFIIEEKSIIKIGQYPSKADLTLIDSKIRNELGDMDSEYVKAINLFSHDVPIASFVYLRRIIEHLIIDAINQAVSDKKYSEEDFKGKRFDEKTEMLKLYLPSQSTDIKAVYDILSLGIHELNDELCMAAFPILKAWIDLVVSDRLSHEETAKLKGEIKSSLLTIQGLLKKVNKT